MPVQAHLINVDADRSSPGDLAIGVGAAIGRWWADVTNRGLPGPSDRPQVARARAAPCGRPRGAGWSRCFGFILMINAAGWGTCARVAGSSSGSSCATRE
jgi:hypothetical protein